MSTPTNGAQQPPEPRFTPGQLAGIRDEMQANLHQLEAGILETKCAHCRSSMLAAVGRLRRDLRRLGGHESLADALRASLEPPAEATPYAELAAEVSRRLNRFCADLESQGLTVERDRPRYGLPG